jgi:hypothetical protein
MKGTNPETGEVEFRDGWRVVPPHVAAMLESIETWTMTYEQAIARANQDMLSRRLEQAQREVIRQHFEVDR